MADPEVRRPTTVRGVGAPEPLEAFDEFVELWQRLLAEQDGEATALVVEGERDLRSVRALGWDGPVVLVHRGRTISATAHGLVAARRKVIVLTDWDVEGGHLAHRLKEFLEPEGLALDLDYRRRLARVLRGELVHVEGLFGWVRRQVERRGEPLEQLFGPRDERGAPRLRG